MSQGFRHLFGQFVKGVQIFSSPEEVVLQYIDDILLCDEIEEACSEASERVLNAFGSIYKILGKGSALSTFC